MAVIFENARIIDGKGDVLEHGFVLINGDRIEKVGGGSVDIGRNGNEIIDLEGRTLLPGLIDCHVHLFMDGDPDPISVFLKDSISMLTLKYARNAFQTLLGGVTTVRALGESFSVNDAINMRMIRGPRILSSGKGVCITGGHGWPFCIEADGADGVRKAVRQLLKEGSEYIKIVATGGVMTEGVQPDNPQFTYEELKAAVDEAHRAGRKTCAHAQATKGIVDCLRAGVDSIEHGVYMDDEALGLFLERKVVLVPTLAAPFHILEAGEKGGVPPWALEKTRKVQAIHINSVKKAFEAGVKIAMGTDSGTPFNRHGKNAKELELLLQAGFSPMDALIASTKTAAEAIGLGNLIGTIESGKLADLIVVEGDPLKDITVLQKKEKMVTVMKGGQFIKKQSKIVTCEFGGGE